MERNVEIEEELLKETDMLTSDVVESIDMLAETIHSIARSKGWWEKDRNDAEMIALMHSELSEALEAIRNNNAPSDKISGFSGVEEEFADTIIRILDFAAARNLNIGDAIIAKMRYNIGRPHKHGGKAF